MKYFLFSVLFMIGSDILSQTVKEKTYTHLVRGVQGDLNKDNLPDKVIVTQDTISENAPYRLQIFFGDRNGQLKLIASSVKIIEPQYPGGRGGYSSGNGFSDVIINKGILSIGFELTRGHFEHKFRFQNGNFELIGYTEGQSNGRGQTYYTDYNLTTGKKIKRTVDYENDKIISNKKTKLLIRPLPKLQDIEPFENDEYLR